MNGGTVEAAARGDLKALREMAADSYASLSGTDELRAIIVYTEAISVARLAATHGERADLLNLLFLLSQFGDLLTGLGFHDHGLSYRGSALLLAETMAEEGDREIADMLVTAGDVLPVEVFQQAKFLRELAGMPSAEQ